jgi:predicted  nucleic acid-binding Zn-ribbon protein
MPEIMTYRCKACGKVSEYAPKTYGGYSVELGGDLCVECGIEYFEIVNRHSKELEDWLNSKKGAK